MVVTIVLSISVLLQFIAAILALRLVRVTEKSGSWLLIAIAIMLMGILRSITLFRLISGDLMHHPDLAVELVALVISVLMVFGIAWIAPLFRTIGESEEKVQLSKIWLIVIGMFGLLCILVWFNEILDFPHILLGAPRTPLNWREALIEMVIITGVGFFVVSKIIHYITERKKAEEHIRHLNSVLKAIRNVNQLIIKEKDRDSLFQKTCDTLMEARGYDAVWLGLLRDGKTFAMIKGSGFRKALSRFRERVMAGDHPPCIKNVFAQNDMFMVVDKSRECGDCFFKSACVSKGVAIIRVEHANRLFGLLTISLASDVTADEEEKELLKEVAGDIGIALHSIELEQAHKKAQEDIKQGLEKLQRILEETVNALASAVGQRDPYTASHQRRVTKLACAIASEMDLSSNQIMGIRIAGLLHDIGKISVPAEILSKPSRLTHAEFEIVKEHSKVGFDILKSIEFPWPVARIVLQHHERLDGSGYPQGLKNESIFLAAKILAVADVVEAMSSNRPYRAARGMKITLEEITKNKGILYDPQAADVCLMLIKEKGFKFE
jgi:putative nucleotidyltransferase with HDIG domain